MEVILLQKVANLGSIGDRVKVKSGYGRNFLVPRGLALRWTRGGEKQIVQIKRARSAREIRDLDHANDVKAQLGGIKVVLRTNAGDAGRLFGSVTTTDVAAAIVDAGGPDLDKRSISIATAIKTVGNHTVSIKLHPEVTVEQAITVAAH